MKEKSENRAAKRVVLNESAEGSVDIFKTC